MDKVKQIISELKVDGIESHRYVSVPGLRVDPDGPGKDWAVELNRDFCAAVGVGLEYPAIFNEVPAVTVQGICHLDGPDPIFSALISLHQQLGPVLGAFG